MTKVMCRNFYPNATSMVIMRVKPAAKLRATAPEWEAGGVSSVTTTYRIAPAENASRKGRAGTAICASNMVIMAPMGSTMPDSAPMAKAFRR